MVNSEVQNFLMHTINDLFVREAVRHASAALCKIQKSNFTRSQTNDKQNALNAQ